MFLLLLEEEEGEEEEKEEEEEEEEEKEEEEGNNNDKSRHSCYDVVSMFNKVINKTMIILKTFTATNKDKVARFSEQSIICCR